MVDDLMLVDAHIHTSGISTCSRVPAESLVKLCADEGLGGIILTNHYKRPTVRGSFSEWSKNYVREYEHTRSLGSKVGLRVFFGVEFTLDCMPKNDFTVYGLDPAEISDAKEPLFEMDLEQLSAYVHARGALIYHAHPFRNTLPVDGRLMDGTEINCHPLYRTCEEKRVRAYADRYGLRVSCGSDYHGDTYKPHCGMLVPASISSTEEMVEYLRSTLRPPLVIAPDPEPDTPVTP